MPEAIRNWDGYDSMGNIIAYESGELQDEEIIKLFQYLVDTGQAWKLQGSYGRMAAMLITNGVVAQHAYLEPERTYADLT